MQAITMPSYNLSYGYIRSVSSYEFLSIILHLILHLSYEKKWVELAHHISDEARLDIPVSHHLHCWEGNEIMHHEYLMTAIGWLLADKVDRVIQLNEQHGNIIFPGKAPYRYGQYYAGGFFPKLVKNMFPADYRAIALSRVWGKRESHYL